MKWTSSNIPDQAGRTVMITGANSGLGYQTALILAGKGAEVVLACRKLDDGAEALQSIKNQYSWARVSMIKLDLADLDSVATCANTFLDTHARLDLLINNAGVMVPPFSRTKQGFELQFGTNHLGHFALTGLLLPCLLHTPGARIVAVTSLGARIGKIDFDDLNYERKPYSAWFAYGQSKLAELMFILELAKKLAQHRLDIVAAAAHPGGSPTNLQRNSGFFMKNILTPLIAQNPSQAALPTLRAACDPNVLNGSFYGPKGLLGMKGAPVELNILPNAQDEAVTRKLWERSEELTKVQFNFTPQQHTFRCQT
jgi:NAD(P)-dependent dehydrogenase (short-subunit alcohol dehydrogenase family)